MATAVEKVKERQRQELEAISAIARKRKKIDAHEEAINTQWRDIGSDMRDLQVLGWSAKQIADMVNVDTRRVSALLRDGEPTPAQD